MSSPQRNSDTENPERPIRERLRNARLVSTPITDAVIQDDQTLDDVAKPPPMPIDSEVAAVPSNMVQDNNEQRGRPSRKRSHEDVPESAQEEPATKSRHGRKRSRELVDDQADEGQSPPKRRSLEENRDPHHTNGHGNPPTSNKRPATPPSDTDDATTLRDRASPRTKKTRSEAVKSTESTSVSVEENTGDNAGTGTTATEQAASEHATETAPRPTAIPSTSGFANASAASPFSALAGTKSPTEQSQTAPSAFQASGFGALAASSSSGFGSLAGPGSRLSSFASPSPAPSGPAFAGENKSSENTKLAPSTFGGALGSASPFAAATSGARPAFAAAGSSISGGPAKGGFGSGLGGGFASFSGSRLGSFASSGVPGVIGSTAKGVKLFASPADDEQGGERSGGEENGEGGDELRTADDEKDERFYEREIHTGEENEANEFTCRAKLYNFVTNETGKKEWKERGLGQLRLNVTKPGPDDNEATLKARLVMRADGSHRVVLNTPVLKSLKFGDVKGERPNSGYVYFMGSIDGSSKLELLQMKLKPQNASELYNHIVELQDAM